MSRLIFLIVLSAILACHDQYKEAQLQSNSPSQINDSLKSVADIKSPAGYRMIDTVAGSFGEWLRNIPLKRDNHVYLYNGSLKRNQSAQFAVLDIPIGHKDLQQCADAVMRLRAEYLFAKKTYSSIEFRDNANKAYRWTGGSDRQQFNSYLEQVFGMCGSASLEKQLRSVADIKDIRPGDVLIKGGFPGHAMIVIEVAINKKGEKLFMLAQSYMPAQDIHIVKNPAELELSPWYRANPSDLIETPEWAFSPNQLRRW